MIHTVKGFGIVNKVEVDVLLELSCFFDDPMDVGNLISGFLPFLNLACTSGVFSSLLLKPIVKDFKLLAHGRS